jgi:hypothetical protein
MMLPLLKQHLLNQLQPLQAGVPDLADDQMIMHGDANRPTGGSRVCLRFPFQQRGNV